MYNLLSCNKCTTNSV